MHLNLLSLELLDFDQSKEYIYDHAWQYTLPKDVQALSTVFALWLIVLWWYRLQELDISLEWVSLANPEEGFDFCYGAKTSTPGCSSLYSNNGMGKAMTTTAAYSTARTNHDETMKKSDLDALIKALKDSAGGNSNLKQAQMFMIKMRLLQKLKPNLRHHNKEMEEWLI
ncbi:hypothetical protein DY000_02055531 [Brassica cretica]|uniref:Uncharacterized protein n=1 Tax=Brassica cretica TaxID=69181 RepID=A0ABQ7AMB9_BRACR|nr:hypothetical protein DY000_02055531 [Brassica cretica]